MAGLILNLASLKAKADAAGVGTTATSSIPSLCPPYSTITGYVTNGSTTVSISGSWASNLLVEDAYVAINKTITGTTTVYRSVSIGTPSAPDIPASGGKVRASAVVSYEWATRTNYSDGTYSDTAYTAASATIYGGYVERASLGTTVKVRTSTGETSTPSGTVAGATRTASAVTIYQAANNITYEAPHFTVSCSDAPASGGYTGTPSINSYSLSYSFTSGSTGSTTTMGTVYYGTSTTLNNWIDPTSTNSDSGRIYCNSSTNTSRHFVGECHVKISSNGKYNTWTTYLYQAAYSVTVSKYVLVPYTESIPNVSAAGGYNSVPTLRYVYTKTVYSDGSSSTDSTDIQSSCTKEYGKSITEGDRSAIQSWSSYPSNCLRSMGPNYSSSSTVFVCYAGIKVSKSGYESAYDTSQCYLDKDTVSYLYLDVTTNAISNVALSGGDSNAITLSSAIIKNRWVSGDTTTGSNVTSNSSLSKYYSKSSNTESNLPTASSLSYNSSSSYSRFTGLGANTLTTVKFIGWAAMKCSYPSVESGYSLQKVKQNAKSSDPVYKVIVWLPLISGSTYATSPSMSFYDSADQWVGAGHVRTNTNGYTENQYSWGASNTVVSKILIVENGSNQYCKYVSVRGHNGNLLLNKAYIGGSTYPGLISLATSFNTGDYTGGKSLNIYYTSS